MNPLMMLFNMIQSNSPQQFIQNIMGNGQMMKNPMISNVIGMAKNGDMSGIEQMARNLCQQKGIDPEEAIEQIRQNFKM